MLVFAARFFLIGLFAIAPIRALAAGGAAGADPAEEQILFTPRGFAKPGQAVLAPPADSARVKITIRDRQTGKPTFCRINVVGPDGNYYFPRHNYLSPFALTGRWTGKPPNAAMGNRAGKAPIRYLGRFFYSWGESEVEVPPGTVRVEVWKGLEYTPQTIACHVNKGETTALETSLSNNVSAAKLGYYSGDSHLHFRRQTDADEQLILDLMEAEDVRYASILAYNEPAGPYEGLMRTQATPQFRGLGKRSERDRGGYHIFSAQEYRSGTYGHLNLYFRDDMVLAGKKVDASKGPLYGKLAKETRDRGGFAFYCHGGYAETNPYAALYADAIQKNVDGVELLQFGIYREMGLEGWYRLLNVGYRFPCLGASDYPACRWLSDCRTYVRMPADSGTGMKGWFDGAAAGRSFVTTGPLLFFDVDGKPPGEQIDVQGKGPHEVTARIRLRSEVAPVTEVQILVNGKTAIRIRIPKGQSTDRWLQFERPLRLTESAWIAARAFSIAANGSADADAHTNPVYVDFDGKRPYNRRSLDALIAKLDVELTAQKKRKFDEKTAIVDYFERSRDILLKIRERNGLSSSDDVHKIAEQELPTLANPGARTHTDAELRAFLKPVPPKSPAEAIKTFECIPGFHMELLASEPAVRSPISGAIDEDGSLYITEMIDYPYYPKPGDKPLGSVRLLRDTDGDGRYDESHVFADHLLWAGGVACWKGGVFVAAPPDIWYFKDTDGDGKAGIQRKVFTGFGTQSQQYMLNNLKWGMDHWIYGSTAGNGGLIRPGDKPDAKPVSVNRHDFRFDPITEKFEAVCGTVQFGNSFDDWGDRFLCSESGPLYQAILDQQQLDRNPYLPAPSGVHNIAGGSVPIFRISPVERWRHIRSSRRIYHSVRNPLGAGVSHHVIDAGAGVTIYRGNAYPSEFYGNAIVGDAQNNLVHRMLLSPEGVTFHERRADAGTEFVRSSDNWFRPVNFINAPDGTLYCLDMSREILESIHIPFDVLKFLDLKAGRDSGRVYRIAPDGFHYPGPPRLAQLGTAELVKLLEHPNGWHRDTAHRLLFERQDSAAVEPLRAMLRTSQMPQARLGALWSLAGLKALEPADLVRAFSDPHFALREHAVRLAQDRLNGAAELLPSLVRLADDPSPRVRMQVAYAMGESKDPRAIGALARILKRDGGNVWIRTAALSSVAETSHQLLLRLLDDRQLAASSAGNEVVEKLANVTGVRNRADEIAALLDGVARRKLDNEAATEIVLGLGEGLRQANGSLHLDANAAGPGEKLLNALVDRARADAQDPRQAVSDRVSAIRLLGCFERSVAGPTLTQLLSPSNPEGVQVAAVAALANHGDSDIARLFLEHWKEYSPEVRTEVLGALLSRETWAAEFLRAAQKDSSLTTPLAPLQRSRLREHKNAVVRDLARSVLGSLSASPRKAVVSAYKSCLSLKPDLAEGRKIFERECSICHEVNKTGYAIGPSLASSNAREPEALLMHVLDPNQYVPPQYVEYVAVDRNGRTHTGILAAQSPTSISLRREKNAVDTLLRANIEELSSTGKSLMPEGFEKKLSKQQMSDLIAYLQTVQASVPPGPQPLDIGTRPGLVEP